MDRNLGLLEYCNVFTEKLVVERERTPTKAIALGVLLYFNGVSLRKVSDLLLKCGIKRSHFAVWEWIQKFGKSVKDDAFVGPMPAIIVADETMVKIGSRLMCLYVAISPNDKRCIYFGLYQNRSYLTTLSFFKEMIKRYGAKPEWVITDGGPWYVDVVCGNLSAFLRNMSRRFYA